MFEDSNRPQAMGTLSFFRAWIADPMRVASVVPSSSALAELITSEVSLADVPVIELGPGTGVFTDALLSRGIPEDKLVMVENGSVFAHRLQCRFPQARVLQMDAGRLKSLDLLEGERAGAVVSGLPLVSMSLRKAMTILEGAFFHMRPEGAFYQFTYGPRFPVPQAALDRLGLKAVRCGHVLFNVPPASVYRISRAPARAERRDRPSD